MLNELGRVHWGAARFYLSNARGRNSEHAVTHYAHAIHPPHVLKVPHQRGVLLPGIVDARFVRRIDAPYGGLRVALGEVVDSSKKPKRFVVEVGCHN